MDAVFYNFPKKAGTKAKVWVLKGLSRKEKSDFNITMKFHTEYPTFMPVLNPDDNLEPLLSSEAQTLGNSPQELSSYLMSLDTVMVDYKQRRTVMDIWA